MKYTYDELAATDNSTGSFLARSAKSARDSACSIYRDYKDWYHSNIDLPSVGGQTLENFLTSLCPSEPPYIPPASTSTFTGGQCTCILYQVNYQFQFINFEQYGYNYDIQNLWGPIGGIRSAFVNGSSDVQIFCRGRYPDLCLPEAQWISVYGNEGTYRTPNNCSITSTVRGDGNLDNCGNLPNASPLAPPTIVNNNITIVNNDGVDVTVPFTFSPKINLPGFTLNGNLNIFKPEFNLNLSPQFNFNPSANLDVKPKINFSFGLDGVDINIGGSEDNDTITNNNNTKNITNTNNTVNNIKTVTDIVNNTVNNINNTTKDTNDDVTIIKDKLACNPCDLLKEIKDKLFKIPTYRSFLVSEFQSIKLDNLADLGFIEIDLTRQPTKTKIIFGGNAPNVMFAGWLTWRKNGYNFSREQVTAEKSIYLAPKGANGFSICCTHNARANCLYYIEIKE